MPDSPAKSSSDRPIRRISSWKVFGIFCLVSFMFLVGVVFIPWDIKPVVAPDLEIQIPQIAPAENAFTWFEKAGLIQHDDQGWLGLIEPIGSPREIWDPVLATAMLDRNAAAISFIEKGLACRQYASSQAESIPLLLVWQWQTDWQARMLCLRSKQRQLAGDPTGALVPALQAFRMGQMIIEGSYCLIEWDEEGVQCQKIALQRLEELVADARTPDTVLAAIQTALDQWDAAALTAGYVQAIRGEYTYMMGCRLSRFQKEGGSRGQDWVWWPSSARVVPYLLKPNMTKHEMAVCCRQQIWKAGLPCSKIMPGYPGRPREPRSMVGRIVAMVRPNSAGRTSFFDITWSFDQLLNVKFALQANVAELRLKIGLRQYEGKHGRLPSGLGELVPEFLRELPNDPFADKPFGYSRDERSLWSADRHAVMPLGTREMKPNLVPQGNSPAASGAKQDKVNRVEQPGPGGQKIAAKY
jgi:hypothetical protein